MYEGLRANKKLSPCRGRENRGTQSSLTPRLEKDIWLAGALQMFSLE